VVINIWLYAGIPEYFKLDVDFGHCSGNTELMPRLSSENALNADNQQGTPILSETPQRLNAKYPKSISREEAILLGILYTDGCLSKKSKNCWRFYLSNTSFGIIKYFKNSMMKVFGLNEKRIRISQKEVNGKPFYKAVVDSGYCGSILTARYGTFRTLAYKDEGGKGIYPLTKLPFNSDSNLKIVSLFLKAAFSCDGGVNLYVANASRYKFLIRNVFLSCKHPQLQLDYFDLLKLFGVKAKILKKDNKLRLQGKDNLMRFYNKIGFLTGVQITQHSAYWQGWEKNKVLKLLLSSYGRPETVFNMPRFLG